MERRDNSSMKKFIILTNNNKAPITVTMGLRAIDSTNIYSPAKDRLNVQAVWTKTTVTVKPGVGLYPAMIKDWDDVKSFMASHVFTYGGETDGETFDDATIKETEEIKRKLDLAIKKYDADLKKNEEIKSHDRERFARDINQ